jgi:tRNA-specific 2-thiouridylase
LRHVIFPLGGYTKARTKTLAKRLKLKSSGAVPSQDICFVQGTGYAEYIKKRAGEELVPGEIVDKEGHLLGTHKGIPFYTIGQRRGLGVAYKEPLYVTGIDIANNRIIVGTKDEVLKKGLIADRVNWIAVGGIKKAIRTTARIRYNAAKAKAVISRVGTRSVKVEFDEPQEAPTPGQAVVFYDKDVVIGGGWIRQAL